MDVYIPKRFKLDELLKSDTAKARGIQNFPTWEIVEKLRKLAERLDIYREALGEPIHINSGYRNPELNVAVGGSSTSHHCKGDAADLRIGNGSTKENAVRLYNFIKEFNKEHGLPVDQVFLEHKTSNDVWWVHFGLNVDDGGKHMRNYYGTLEVK